MRIIKRIEQKKIDLNEIQITFLGQSGYIIKTKNAILYIDPYLTDYIEHREGLNENIMQRNYPSLINPEEINILDAILCTHSHADHMDPWTLERIKKDFILICTENAFNSSLIQIKKNIRFIDTNNDQVNIKGIKISAIPAAHHHLTGENGKADCVSYIVEYNSKKLFFWGDGVIYEGLIDKLKQFSFDLFFAPINGRDWFREKMGIIGNLNSRELVHLCKEVDIDFVVPNHYDLFDNNGEFIQHFLNYLKVYCPNQLFKILSRGDTIYI